jgi:hypothetical protein
MSVYLNSHGHQIEIQKWCGQGGEAEDFAVWCHTCDPHGGDVKTVDIRAYDNYHEAASAALVSAREHVWQAVRLDGRKVPPLG